jgi:hypothetical protein
MSSDCVVIFFPSIHTFPGVAGRSKTTVPVVGAGGAAGGALCVALGAGAAAVAEEDEAGADDPEPAEADADKAPAAGVASRGRRAFATTAATRMNPHPARATATMRPSRLRRSGSAVGGVLGGVLCPDEGGRLLGEGGLLLGEGGLLLGVAIPSAVRRGMTWSSSDASGEPGLM